MPFKDYLVKLGPSWLQRATWRRYLEEVGSALDVVATSAKVGTKERLPDFAATDALTAIGGERQLPRAPGEQDSTYAARLKDAWQTWYWGGTAFGLLSALRTAGYPTALVEIVGGLQYSLDGAGRLHIVRLPAGSWLIGSDQTFWSRFQVLFTHPTLPAGWGRRLPAPDSDEVNLLRALVRKWSPGFATCSGIVVVREGRCFGYPLGRNSALPLGLTFGTLAQRGYGFSGNDVVVWEV